MPADIVGFGDAGVWVALSNGDGTFQPMQLVINDFGYDAGSWRVDMHPRVLADVTGNGRADIVGFGNAGVYVALSNGDGTFTEVGRVSGNFGAGHFPEGWESYPRLLADVAGDGRADIVALSPYETHVLLSNGDGTFQDRYYVESIFAFGSLDEEIPVVLADITGDRRPDIVMIDYRGVTSALNNGDGSFQPSRLVSRDFANRHYYEDTQLFAGDWQWGWQPRYLADITGDGRADIVGFGNDGVWVALANGDGTFQPAHRTIANFGVDHDAGGWTADRYPRTVADLTGRRLRAWDS